MKTFGLEFAMLMRGGKTLAAAIVFALTVLVSGISSWTANHHADQDKFAVASAERQRWLHQSAKDPHQAAHYSIYAFKPSMPLQSLDPGIQPFVGQAVWLEPHWQNDMVYRPLQDAEPFQRMGVADPAKFLVEFSPLLVFLISFAAIGADRERGIMRLALGAAKKPGIYVWGKWGAVVLFSAIALLLPALVVGLATTALGATFDNLLRLACWGAAFLAYIAILGAIGVVVCLNAGSARIGFAVLLGLWALLAFVAPRAASSLAGDLTPLPSYAAVKLQMQNEAPIYWSAETAEAQTRILMKRYHVTRREDLPVDLRGALIDFNERRSHPIFDRILGGFYKLVSEQDRTFAAQSWMSPAIATQALSSAFAGSNFAHHDDFIIAAENYRRELVDDMNALLLRAPSSHGEYVIKESTASAGDFKHVPTFSYVQPDIRLAFTSAGSAPFFLVGWMVAGAIALGITTRRIHP